MSDIYTTSGFVHDLWYHVVYVAHYRWRIGQVEHGILASCCMGDVGTQPLVVSFRMSDVRHLVSSWLYERLTTSLVSCCINGLQTPGFVPYERRATWCIVLYEQGMHGLYV